MPAFPVSVMIVRTPCTSATTDEAYPASSLSSLLTHTVAPVILSSAAIPALRPPGRHDDAIAVDERRLADQPVDIAAVEFTQDVAPPDDLAVSDQQTDEIAVLREHVDTIAIDSRRAARTRAAIVLLRRAEGDGPDRLSRLARSRLVTTLWRFFMPCTKTRLPATATEP